MDHVSAHISSLGLSKLTVLVKVSLILEIKSFNSELSNVLILNIVGAEAVTILNVVDKLVPDSIPRFSCAQHNTRSGFHVMWTMDGEGWKGLEMYRFKHLPGSGLGISSS